MLAILALLLYIASATTYQMVATVGSFTLGTNWNPERITPFTKEDTIIVPFSGSFTSDDLSVGTIQIKSTVTLKMGKMDVDNIQVDNGVELIVLGTVNAKIINGNCKIRLLNGATKNMGTLYVQSADTLVVNNSGEIYFDRIEDASSNLKTVDIDNYGDVHIVQRIMRSNNFVSHGGNVYFYANSVNYNVELFDTNIDDASFFGYVTLENCICHDISMDTSLPVIKNTYFNKFETYNPIISDWFVRGKEIIIHNTNNYAIKMTNSLIDGELVTIDGIWEIQNCEIGNNVKLKSAMITVKDDTMFFGILSVSSSKMNYLKYNGTDVTVDTSSIDNYDCHFPTSFTSTTFGTLNCFDNCLIDDLETTTFNVKESGCRVISVVATNMNVQPEKWYLPRRLTINTLLKTPNIVLCESICSLTLMVNEIAGLNVFGGSVDLTIGGGKCTIFSNSTLSITVASKQPEMDISIENNTLKYSGLLTKLTTINSTVSSLPSVKTLRCKDSQLSIGGGLEVNSKTGYIEFETIDNCSFSEKAMVYGGTPTITLSTFESLFIESSIVSFTDVEIAGTFDVFNSTLSGTLTSKSITFSNTLLDHYTHQFVGCISKFSFESVTSTESTLVIPCVSRFSNVNNIIPMDVIIRGDMYIGYGTSLNVQTMTNNGRIRNYGVITLTTLVSTSETSTIDGDGSIFARSAFIKTVDKNVLEVRELTLFKIATIKKLTFLENAKLDMNNYELTATTLTISNRITVSNPAQRLITDSLILNGNLNLETRELSVQSGKAVITNCVTKSTFYTTDETTITNSQLKSVYGSNSKLTLTETTLESLNLTESHLYITNNLNVSNLNVDKTVIYANGDNSMLSCNGLCSFNQNTQVQVKSTINYILKGNVLFTNDVVLSNLKTDSDFQLTSSKYLTCEGDINTHFQTIFNKGNMHVGPECTLRCKLFNYNTLLLTDTNIIDSTIENNGTMAVSNIVGTNSIIKTTSSAVIGDVQNLDQLVVGLSTVVTLSGNVQSAYMTCDGALVISKALVMDIGSSTLTNCQLRFPNPVNILTYKQPSTTTPKLISVYPELLPVVGDVIQLIRSEGTVFPTLPTSEVSGVDSLALSRDMDNKSYNITITPCPSGSIFIQECIQCDNGKYQVGTSCFDCAPGTHSDGFTCSPCASGFFNSISGKICESCPLGYWSNTSSASCYICPAGYYRGATDEGCKSCLNGYVSNFGSSECSACPNGTVTEDSITCKIDELASEDSCELDGIWNIDHCLKCDNGFPDNGTCVICPKHYKPNEEYNGCVLAAPNQWKVQLFFVIFFFMLFAIFIPCLVIHIIKFYRDEQRSLATDRRLKSAADKMKEECVHIIEGVEIIPEEEPNIFCPDNVDDIEEIEDKTVYTMETEDIPQFTLPENPKTLNRIATLSQDNATKEDIKKSYEHLSRRLSHVEEFLEEEKKKISAQFFLSELKTKKDDNTLNREKTFNNSSSLDLKGEHSDHSKGVATDVEASEKSSVFEDNIAVGEHVEQLETISTLEKGENEVSESEVNVEHLDSTAQEELEDTEPLETSETPREGLHKKMNVSKTSPMKPKIIVIDKNKAMKSEVTIAVGEINRLKTEHQKEVNELKSIVRSLQFVANETQQKLHVFEKAKEELEQQELKARKEEQMKRAGIDGGSRVEHILINGVNPRFIPLDDNNKPTGYMK
ncbi:hypothetical protein EIN_379270 [Entamoeba invadens IP1]|uniref:Tyrosine-protein kinase ephrin type A/B receptor-like domain-containing protein n=1 Tax=Entamoeba invadens IP1 TaxID=370355 RepID=A0A0A1UAQ5_ENTIV|nr:hypothetical protein EIN_379270 [Entamoeba invadens IP1]ELP92060.1 hypothetical protein EIN_379270 [Entamoeba invadens IP1]|eukprot:XP_004258831.1 hypothetical protein EIN_379270 [Entamoeba invadens IP1]